MESRPAGHGVKRIWETASEEELQDLSKFQEEGGFSLDAEGAAMEDSLSTPLDDLIEEILAEGSSVQVDSWLVDPALEVPASLLFEGGKEEGTGHSQDSPEAGTSRGADSTILATTLVVAPPASSGAVNLGTVQQFSQQIAWTATGQSPSPSSVWTSQDARILDHWTQSASFVSPSVEAEQTRISGGSCSNPDQFVLK
ncbi:uncharacterized protein EMH_0000100 [Eimeria mitis]|uniref:Uncharacterized protein n=1 Tax=Eimeria mitis TaxID=44415 RepID=U6KG63_9EIME|nr:uncharacterized protein EMH_0000100 [Eimeria mitis]CDJ35776.1 hypothetical protein EMH_0000100 [Eimeria mitis]